MASGDMRGRAVFTPAVGVAPGNAHEDANMSNTIGSPRRQMSKTERLRACVWAKRSMASHAMMGDADHGSGSDDAADSGALSHGLGTLRGRNGFMSSCCTALLSPVGKRVTLGTALVLLTAGALGCARLRVNFLPEWFVPSGTALAQAIGTRDMHFGGSFLPFALYTKAPTTARTW